MPQPPSTPAGTTTEAEGGGRRRRAGGDRAVLWRAFWGAHQAFFRHMTMAAKVGGLWASVQRKYWGGADTLRSDEQERAA